MNSIKEIIDSMLDPQYSFAENHIVTELSLSRTEYERQFKIGAYFADFYFPKYNVVLEVDGKKFHSSESQIEHDSRRNEYMNNKGYTVIRATGSLVQENPSGILSLVKYLYRPKTYLLNSESDIKNIFEVAFRDPKCIR